MAAEKECSLGVFVGRVMTLRIFYAFNYLRLMHQNICFDDSYVHTGTFCIRGNSYILSPVPFMSRWPCLAMLLD